MTIPAVSRSNIAIRLAATVWMSSARTTRGLAISSKTPARERTVKPIVRPALPRGRRMTRTCVASSPGPARAAAITLTLRCLPGAEIDEDVQALQAPGHGGSDAIERRKRTRRDAQRMPGGRRDAADLALESRIGEREWTHRPHLAALQRRRHESAKGR